jgi:hypothetical protein
LPQLLGYPLKLLVDCLHSSYKKLLALETEQSLFFVLEEKEMCPYSYPHVWKSFLEAQNFFYDQIYHHFVNKLLLLRFITWLKLVFTCWPCILQGHSSFNKCPKASFVPI